MTRQKSILFILVFTVSAIVYAMTLCPTVEFIDSGELALAAKNLGIAHPTGYPLYTLLGRLASVFLWGNLIHRVNLLSLLLTSFASGILYLLILEIIISKSSHRHGHTVDQKTGQVPNYKADFLFHIIAACTALFMAFSPTWWSQGTTNEVYSLNLLLITISLWLFIKSINAKTDRGNLLLMAIFLLGLCFTNHLSAIYLLPGYLYILILELGKARIKIPTILTMLGFFIFPATLYLFLPVRAHFRPFLNWGGVDRSFYFFYKHITGWQYQVWMFQNPLGAFSNLAKLDPSAKLILAQFGWIGLAVILIGIIAGVIRYRRILIFASIISLCNLIYVLNYDIPDIDSYYLPMFLMLSIFFSWGIVFLSEKFLSKTPQNILIKYVIAGAIIILPLSNLLRNYYESDRSNKTFAKKGVIDLANSMQPDGLTLVENWDFYSPWLYLHFAENYRPDTKMLDKELMRRSWYVDFIRRYFPDIYARSKPEFEEFLRQVEPYEHGRPYNSDAIDNAYYGMLHAVIEHESTITPVCTNIFDDQKLVSGNALAPDGILFRFHPENAFLESPLFSFDESFWADKSVYKDVRVGYLLSFYARAFNSRCRYCQYFSKPDEADYYRNLESNVGERMGEIKDMK
jgi:hypothetical protein